MQGHYDVRLVTLSVLIAICAAYAALELAARTTAARGRGRLAWLSGGAIAMGFGIWSMHYVGMLACKFHLSTYSAPCQSRLFGPPGKERALLSACLAQLRASSGR